MDLGKIAAIPARSPDFGSGRVRINSAGAPRAGLLPPLSPGAPQGCPRAHAPICAERPVRSSAKGEESIHLQSGPRPAQLTVDHVRFCMNGSTT
jgi:hypothetical protein